MFLRSIKLFVATLTTVVLSVACGGDSAPAATGVVLKAGESTVTVSWDMTPGVEYWLFYAPTSVAPADTTSMQKWIGLPGGNVMLNVSSPYVISGWVTGTSNLVPGTSNLINGMTYLVNGTNYSFSLNGRTNGGPGGPGSTPVSITPRIAGSIWSAGPTNPPGSNDLRSVTYGVTAAATTTTTAVSTYVAAGMGGAMYSSLDGTSWNAINYATTSNLNGASYFGTYKLVGDSGLVLLSSDAATWTPQTTGTTQNLYAIANNSLNLNVAVGANGTIIVSSDGITWTPASNSATTRDLYGVTYSAYNSGTWIAVGAGGTIVESSDGLTWHTVTSGTGVDLRGIAYGSSTSTAGVVTTMFAAVGASGTVLSSADGATWVSQVLPGVSALNAVIYGTQFVAAGTGGNIFISTDGVTWTLISPIATSKDLYALARGSFAYSAVGAVGTNLLSK